MYKNVATKLIVFAWDATTGLPKTGDASNITSYVDIDFAGVNQLADTSASEIDSTNAKGYYQFDVAQGETNGNALLFTSRSTTTNIVVVAVPAMVFTTPNHFSDTVISSGGTVNADAKAINAVATTSVTAVNANVGTTQPTNFSGTGASAYVKSDLEQWIGTAPLALSSQQVQAIVPDTQKVDLNTIKTQAVTCAAGVTVPALIASTTNITAGTVTTVSGNVNGSVNSVTTGVTVTTNNDKTGYSLSTTQTFNNTGAWTGNITGNLSGSVGSVTGNVGGNVVGTVASVVGAVGSVTGNVGGNVTGSVGSISGITFPTNFGSMDINATGGVGLDWANVQNPTTTLNLSGTTIKAVTDGTGGGDLTSILGTAITESVAGRLAGAFSTFLNVATPVFTVASVNQTGDSFARIGATGSGLTSLAPSSTALSTTTWTNGLAASLTTLASHDPGSTIAAASSVNTANIALVKIQAATYDSNTSNGTNVLTLSNNATLTFNLTTGARTQA